MSDLLTWTWNRIACHFKKLLSNVLICFLFRIFTEEEVKAIRTVRLYDIIVNATGIKPGEIQEEVFFWMDGDPCGQPAQLNTSMMEPCKVLRGYDYFHVRLKVFGDSFRDLQGQTNMWTSGLIIYLKGTWYSLQIWTYVVNIDKTFSLHSVWGQLILLLICYGMKNEADRGSFLWEFSSGGLQKILSMGFYSREDPLWVPL